MNINELEELTKRWSEVEPEEYPATVIELIAAYREAVAALEMLWVGTDYNEWDGVACKVVESALATAKRLGVE